jgi:N utilization substance protein B
MVTSPGDKQASHAGRSAARLAATQALYQLEMTKAGTEDVIAEFVEHRFVHDPETGSSGNEDEAFFQDLVRGVVRHQGQIDQALAGSLAANWTLARIDSILRALLRAGGYELFQRSDVPVKVVIDEYVELAKDFFDGDEPSFVNAVLDKMARNPRGELLGS